MYEHSTMKLKVMCHDISGKFYVPTFPVFVGSVTYIVIYFSYCCYTRGRINLLTREIAEEVIMLDKQLIFTVREHYKA